MKKRIYLLVTISFALILLLAVRIPLGQAEDRTLTDITAEQLVTLLEQKDILIIDVRPESFYAREHLPGAVSVPYEWRDNGPIASRKGTFDSSVLPKDKDVPIVFYADGPSRLKSFKAFRAAIDAIEMGYTRVFYFGGGFSEWKDAMVAIETTYSGKVGLVAARKQ